MKILVLNCGSSSLKYQLIDMDGENVLAKGLCERIGIEGSNLAHSPAGGAKHTVVSPMEDHSDAIRLVMDALTDPERGVIASTGEIDAIGHRVVHGGEAFAGSVAITDEVIKAIEDVSGLAPLHNPPNLTGIAACKAVMPNVPQAAVFDTAFHQSLPEKAYLYAIPYELYEKYKIRRYGFHGTSHRYVSERAAAMLGKDAKDLKIITCHLGNGGSVAAVDGGRSVDTSMGFTPLEGLAMGTRSGDIDAAVIPYIMDKEGVSAGGAVSILNKKSGVLGLSGVSSDFRDIESAADGGNARARAALDVFLYRVAKYVGAYAAAMNGVDAVVFTAGLGENSAQTRKAVCSYLGFLGLTVDDERNAQRGGEFVFSTDGSKVAALTIPTNEEIVIARDTAELFA
ncbi:MAG: acetate kinase [Clostridiales bacterium]|jgi:acetate kinase|nr:acetate kinase [Clostridiales bacterium]